MATEVKALSGLTAERPPTLEEFLRWPETEPASEYLEGRVVQKVSPKTEHSWLQYALCRCLNDALQPHYYAFPELRCTFSGRSLIPDIAVLKQVQIPRNAAGRITGRVLSAPDAVVEIASSEQRAVDLIAKLSFYMQHGVQVGWLIDPEAQRVLVFRPEGYPVELPPDGVLEEPSVLPGFRLGVGELFGWLKLPK